ncbi:MAG: RsmE family RNA methyltransferase [Planctomycetaceae bacterium]
MTVAVCYAPETSYALAQVVEIVGAEAHHLKNVLRLQSGSIVELFNGRGARAVARIVDVSRRVVTLEIHEPPRMTIRPNSELVLATAVPKGDRFRWMVEKAAELGAARMIPLNTQRSVVQPGSGKLDKLRQTIIAAAKQSRQDYLMELESVTEWSQFLKSDCVSQADCWLAHPGAEPVASLVGPQPVTGANVLVVGPEGGFTDDELQQAQAAGLRAIGLGRSLLRVETAALMFLGYFRALSCDSVVM